MKMTLRLMLAFAIMRSCTAYSANSEASSGPVFAGAGELPAYTFACTDGLYASICGTLRIKNIKVRNEKSLNLIVAGFARSVSIKAVIQDHSAPLTVVILGLSGKTNADYSKVWPAWLSDAGHHVLYFDSTFGSSFHKVSRHGVSGNLWAETERIRDIITAFLDHPDMRGKVSEIGIAGYSYGGVQALLLGQMAKVKKLPFTISGIQAYSPPIDLLKTAEILDAWYRTDRWNFTAAELQRMFRKLPSFDVRPEKISESAMRAAVADVFRTELSDVVLATDAIYNLGNLPKGNDFDHQYIKIEYAQSYGFLAFARKFARPYWQAKLSEEEINRLADQTNLCRLLQEQPAYSETIISADDPFNTLEDLNKFKGCAVGHRLTVLPRGGHIGYMSDEWTRAKLLTLTSPAPKN